MKSDADVIATSVADSEAFGAIFERHFAEIFAYCYRRAGAARAEDLAGEVFRRAFEFRNRYDSARADARPWLFGIAAHVVTDHFRSSGRERVAMDRSVASVGPLEDSTLSVDASIDAMRDLDRVGQAMEKLPPEELETLLLFAWEELSYAEIGEALQIPLGTVRSRLNRVRRRLQRS